MLWLHFQAGQLGQENYSRFNGCCWWDLISGLLTHDLFISPSVSAWESGLTQTIVFSSYDQLSLHLFLLAHLLDQHQY